MTHFSGLVISTRTCQTYWKRSSCKAMAKDPNDRYESMLAMNLAFAAAMDESVDRETGLARAEYIGPAPETQVIVHKERGVIALLTRNRVATGVVLLALLALPMTAFALNGRLSGLSGAVAGSQTPTPSQFLLATIDALSNRKCCSTRRPPRSRGRLKRQWPLPLRRWDCSMSPRRPRLRS